MNQYPIDKEWECIDAFAGAFETLIRATEETMGRSLMHTLLAAFDVLLTHPERRYEYQVLNQAADYMLSAEPDYRLHPSEVWDWLRKIARRADEYRRIAMTIAIFKPLAEDIDWNSRRDWELVTPLYQYYTDPELQWVLVKVFDDHPAQLLVEYERFLAASKKFLD